MSSRDALQTINGAYHKQDGDKIGFYMYKLASYKDGNIVYSDSTFPMCGPLLFVVTENRRRTLDLEIGFRYKQATEAGYQTSSVRGITIKEMTYTEGVSWQTGTITLEVSKQGYYEKLFKSQYDEGINRTVDFYGEYLFKKDNTTIDLIHELDDIAVSHADADWDVYTLATNGARIAYGYSYNQLREQGDNIIRSFFVAPRLCPLCEGRLVYPTTGEETQNDEYGNVVPKYTGNTCPECNGFGYSGFNAEGGTLDLKAYDVGVSRAYAESDEKIQRYSWAERWWFYPTIDALKNYISFFTRINKDDITIIQYGVTDRTIDYALKTSTWNDYADDNFYYGKESYLDIKIPVTELTASGYDINFVEDIIKTKLPIGTTYKVSAFNVFTSGGDLDNEFDVLNEDFIAGQLYKTSMIFEAYGQMYNWMGDGIKGVYDSATWEGTTNTGTADQIGSIYQYGATTSSFMAKGSAFNVNDNSDIWTTESTGDVSTTTNVYLTDGSTTDDVYNGWYITNNSETRLISDYDGATKMVTCAAFTGAPADGSVVYVHEASTWDILSDNIRATGQAANFFKSVTTSNYNDIITYDNFWAELETTGTVSFVR
jgi:hypothetical protein